MKIKYIILSISLLFSFNATSMSAGDEINDYYTYIGAGFGLTYLNTNVPNEQGDKNGTLTNFSLKGTYYEKSWLLSMGLGYHNLYMETETKGANYIKLITETFYAELAPEYRITNRFSFGFIYQQLIGEELLAGPSTTLNANNEKTTQSIAGLIAHYEIPFKNFRMRVGLSVLTPLGIGNRDIYIPLLTLQFGTAIFSNKQPEKIKIVYKTKEIIKTIPAEVIELGEQVINFKSGSYRLSTHSTDFTKKLATLLVEHTNSWQIIRLVGHTDVVGAADANLVLSENRASAVKNIIIASGVSRDRIFSLGLGEEKLKTIGTSLADHLTNRRVELQFIGQLNKDFVQKVKELVRLSSL